MPLETNSRNCVLSQVCQQREHKVYACGLESSQKNERGILGPSQV